MLRCGVMRKVTRGKKSSPLRGRPRAFDTEKALEAALRVFWEKGYEGTSLTDLTAAMRINRPSLYAAFGDKEALFRKVLDRYTGKMAAYVDEALAEPSARRAIERLLEGAADTVTNPRNPHGCLLVQGALACGKKTEGIRQELVSRRAAGEGIVRKRLLRAQKEGDLPPEADPTSLARYYVTILRGMGVDAASGASRKDLQNVIELSIKAWPE